MNGMRLMERDFCVFKEIDRWRFLLSRHIQTFCGFSGERACHRRLKVLMEAGYIERQHLFYGLPSLYSLTHKGKVLIGTNQYNEKIRLEQVPHDVMVLDTAMYLVKQHGISLEAITTEKQLHQSDGFSIRMHRPDFVYTNENKTACVEVELSQKSKERFLKNLKDNFSRYDEQLWILPKRDKRNHLLIEKSGFTDIRIIESEVIEHNSKRETK